MKPSVSVEAPAFSVTFNGAMPLAGLAVRSATGLSLPATVTLIATLSAPQPPQSSTTATPAL
jgi:hypothetical protein